VIPMLSTLIYSTWNKNVESRNKKWKTKFYLNKYLYTIVYKYTYIFKYLHIFLLRFSNFIYSM
jgi:hypothetical protein